MSSLVSLREGGAGQPLYCFHALSGLLVKFAPLLRHLGDGRPILGLQARGLDPDVEPHRELRHMARDYAAEIREAQARGPYALYGWSMGGPLAYEVARQLTEAGETVSLLALGDSDVVADRMELQRYVWPNVMRNVLGLGADPDEYLELEAGDRASRLARLAIDAGSFPADSDIRTVTRMLEIYDINAEAVAGYRAEPYPGRVVLLRTEEYSPFGDTLGWRPYVGELVIHRIPATHYELMSPENVPAIARILDHYLCETATVTCATSP